jgi:hypothetical protein
VTYVFNGFKFQTCSGCQQRLPASGCNSYQRLLPEDKADILQKEEIGPYAFESQMPTWLRTQLEGGGKVTCDILPVLTQLCEQDRSLHRVSLCHIGVKHVAPKPGEEVFTGYQNIQMLISYIQAAHLQGFEHFEGRLPTILRLQDMIEEAWDKGINIRGRIETGGIRGTRKYIGTPEVTSFVTFRNSQISVNLDRLKRCS